MTPAPPPTARSAPTRRSVLGTAVVVGAIGLAGEPAVVRRAPAGPSLHSQTVAFWGSGQRRSVVDIGALLHPRSRVFADAAQLDMLVEQEQGWIGRAVLDGTRAAHAEAARSALLDLRVLTLPNGAVVAGWSRKWRLLWPRDSAFVVAALSRYGYAGEAAQVLRVLQRTLPAHGVFQARYLPDGSGRVPDSRGVQRDGSGWVLWGVEQWARSLGPVERRTSLPEFLSLISAAASACARMTRGGTALPPPSADFWELAEAETTLGTAAPVLAGLRSAARIYRSLGERGAASQYASWARRFWDVVRLSFAPNGFARYPGTEQRDAAVTFLLPPFTDAVDPDVLSAWHAARRDLRRPAGGFAPGGDWQDGGISWTPETALFALTAAASGLAATAGSDLAWLTSHRTLAGSFPEKVLADGTPVSVAPLAWTAATFLLALDVPA